MHDPVIEQMMMSIRVGASTDAIKLDQGETAFALESLVSIDTRIIKKQYAALMGKKLFPKKSGLQPWTRIHKYREMEMSGIAQPITHGADDFPVVAVKIGDLFRPIQPYGLGYTYDIAELKAAAKGGEPIDQYRAEATRDGMEMAMDRCIAYGLPSRKIYGALTYDSAIVPVTERVATVTPGTKAAGGTGWGTILVPVASGREMVDDVIKLVSVAHSALQGSGAGGAGQKFRVVMSPEMLALLAATDYGIFNTRKALTVLLEFPLIEGIYDWYACAAANSGGALTGDIMMAYIPEEDTIAHLTSMEWTPMAPQQRNLTWITNTIGECGGTLIRQQYRVRYMKF